MKKNLILVLYLLAFSFYGVCQKVDGPVLKSELYGRYEGALKKGLAHGKGTASGRDTYTGDFKRGLPDGDGIYTDSLGNIYNGTFRLGKKDGMGTYTPIPMLNQKSTTGYWQDDKYIGKEKVEPYVISNKTGSVQPRIFKTGEGNKVELSVLDPFSNYVNAQIFVIGQYVQKSITGREYYEEVVFPIEFDVKYTCYNKLRTGLISNTIRIKINKSGNWTITLKN